MTDEILDEVRRAREAYGERFGFDIEAIGRDLREQARLGGRTIVSFPPRRTDPATGEAIAVRDAPASMDPAPVLDPH